MTTDLTPFPDDLPSSASADRSGPEGGLGLVAGLESELRSRAAELSEPAGGECLVCYVWRMLEEFQGCGGLIWAARFRDLRAPRATALAQRLMSVGAGCDCELFLNGYRLGDRYFAHVGDGEMRRVGPQPECRGTRLGSTRPCSLWIRIVTPCYGW